ncbi:hypothetical protein [Halobellus ordinarius]|uniref:hypothetical protein n=1 Tax=Halobellus ordinarius TaxID=3075120 RepID=UPI0028804C23|nr:hypothetical protein [Halobellus sp. ZY16]
MINWLEIIVDGLVTFATPLSVLFIAYQLVLRKRQFTTQFEDGITEQYRELIGEIPVEAFLGEKEVEDYTDKRQYYYEYIDLSNEQAFLRQEGRVSKSTWENWRDGIESNLDQPSFEQAWEDFKQSAPNSFKELRKLENEGMSDDPREWEHPWRAKIEAIWYTIRY